MNGECLLADPLLDNAGRLAGGGAVQDWTVTGGPLLPPAALWACSSYGVGGVQVSCHKAVAAVHAVFRDERVLILNRI